MLIAAIMLAASPPEGAARGIREFCRSAPACVAEQQQALRHYLGIWVMYDAQEATAEQCMRAGKRGKLVDWTAAERCMRQWSKGRKPLIGGR